MFVFCFNGLVSVILASLGNGVNICVYTYIDIYSGCKENSMSHKAST